MAFQYLLRVVLYFLIALTCVLSNPGCTSLSYAFANDHDYFSTWELEYPGRYKLIWYYYTEQDFNKNQPNKVLVGDKEFFISPDVRPPTFNGIYLLEYSKVNEGEEILDIGTGSGIHAIFAAEKAKHIVATDIFAPAIENARANAQRHGVGHKIDFRAGDLFEPLKEGEKFDAFFFNINFPLNHDDTARNSLHERLFSGIRKYMKPNARIYFQVSFVKNIPYIYDMLNRNRFHIMEMHMEHNLRYHHEPFFLMIQSK